MTKKAMIFCDTEDNIGRATNQIFENFFSPEKVDIVTENLRQALLSEKYGLVIDTTTIGKKEPEKGAVDARLGGMHLDEPPEVVCLYSPLDTLFKTTFALGEYYGLKK